MITLTGDWGRFDDRLQRLAGFSFIGLHREIGEHLVSATYERFDREETPEGQRWPRSQRVLKMKRGKTLQLSRRLRNSIGYHAQPDRVEVGTNVIYARIHQLGGEAGRGRRVKIPARSYLGVSDADREAITGIINRRIEERLR